MGCLALLTCHYKNDREKVIGMLETSMMIGMLLGPVLGAGMYSIGGYLGPFYFFAVTNLLVYIYMVIPMIKDLNKKEEEVKQDEEII